MLDVSIHNVRGASCRPLRGFDVVRIDTAGGESGVNLFVPEGRGAALAAAVNAAAGRKPEAGA
jgi:hypothetical protein